MASRYVSSDACVECVRGRNLRARRGLPRPPRTAITEYDPRPLKQNELDAWHARMSDTRPNDHLYKHHPLDEVSVLYSPPARKALETMK